MNTDMHPYPPGVYLLGGVQTKSSGKWIRSVGTGWGGVDILERVVGEGCTEKLMLEESPGGSERTNHGDIKGENIPSKAIRSCKGPGVEAGWVYLRSWAEASVAEQSEPGKEGRGR